MSHTVAKECSGGYMGGHVYNLKYLCDDFPFP